MPIGGLLAQATIGVNATYTGRPAFDRARNDIRGLEARAGQAASLLSARFRSVFLAASAAIAGTGAVFAKVEKAQVGLGRVTELHGTQLAALSQSLREQGLALGLTEEATLRLGIAAAKAGVEGAELPLFLNTARKASVALEADLEGTANTLAQLKQALVLNVDEVDKLTGAIIALDNVSAAAFPSILDAMKRVGPIAHIIGLSGSNLAALVTTLVETGVSAERAGTALSRTLSALLSRSEELGPLLGFSADEMRRMARSDPAGTILQVSRAFARLVEEGKDTSEFLRAFGGDGQRMIAVLALLGGRSDRARELIAIANKEFEQGSLLTRFFGLQVETLSFAYERLKASVLGAVEAIGARFRPLFQAIAGILTTVAEAFRTNAVLQYAAAFTLLGAAIASAVFFVKFFIVSQVVAFSVASRVLPQLTGNWFRLGAAVRSATAALSVSGRVGAMTALGSGSGTIGVMLGYVRGIMGAILTGLRPIGLILSRLFLPVTIALAAFEAIRHNLLGSRDALRGLIEPWKEIFGKDGTSALKSLVNFLTITLRLLGYIAAVVIRVLVPILHAILFPILVTVKAIVSILKLLDKYVFTPIRGGLNMDKPDSSVPAIPLASPTPAKLATVTGSGANTGGGRNVTVTINNPNFRDEQQLSFVQKEISKTAQRLSVYGAG